MDFQEIEVSIDSKGKVQIHVRGIQGEACLELTEELEALLGGDVIDRKMTSEAYPTNHKGQTGQRLQATEK